MTTVTLFAIAKLFLTSNLSRAEAIAKFGKVTSEERSNLILDPLPEWHARRITLELSKLASGDDYVAGVIVEVAAPVAVAPADLRKAWGAPHPMPTVKPDEPQAVRFDLPEAKWSGYALLSYRGAMSDAEIKVEQVIFRRFEK